ncbi:di-heme oxidoredictase family protein [Haliangium sp.]|uniref:di-heme oxidoredictase family protein n=1 Tax=Haliangium sp. TaxID=2663208 RepID=UPI003D13FD13
MHALTALRSTCTSAALLAALLATLAAGCSDDTPADEPDAGAPDAGAPDAGPPDTIPDDIFADLGEPMPSATPVELGIFERGREVALHRFTAAEGFGPHFNVSFCVACHEKPAFGGAAGRYRNFLLVGQVLPDDTFGPTGVNGVQPQYTLDADTRFATDDKTNRTATRNPIPFFGVGLLAEIPEAEILSREDPDDADGDGISGRANYERGFLGRFGRKSQSAAIEAFIRGPLFNHLGITSNPLPDERRAELPVASEGGGEGEGGGGALVGPLLAPQVGAPDMPLLDADSAPDPELSEDELFDLVAFSMLLAAPRPDPSTPAIEAGRALFEQAACTGCHVPTLKGPRGLIPAYTDLLIHDMGTELSDGILMGVAAGSEFRTAPLWGVAATAPYLHDGRADTLDQAIRAHGGEAEAARDAYVALSEDERGSIIGFLESLGGASQRSDGLLPPGAELLDEGEYGGPARALDATESERFRRGRAVFDQDRAIAAGLGPFFNGDACRACHFDPVIGGAGPTDVNVVRHGIVTGDVFETPSIGTMAHRHAIDGSQRPPIDANANVFEARQTPPIFGLGLIDRIPDANIIANEDPDDSVTPDGISGRAHILGDARLGRLGWKANVPSLAEFARDAMSNEMGVSLPAQAGLSFGFGTDGDDVTDPEITVEELEDLTFFMSTLAPPPRTSVQPEREDEGEIVFTDIGCGSCHIPTLKDDQDNDVPLYSDLLLHDVAPSFLVGIEDGDAGMREFRTPPLWGLATTAPYMHDGRAATVEEAILDHAGEAKDARDAYLELPLAMQQSLLFFLESL